MVYQRQYFWNDCASACLVMLASYYQRNICLRKVNCLCKRNICGTTLNNILAAAKEIGIAAKAFKANPNEINIKTIPVPCIAHIKYSWLKLKHFVIVAKIDSDTVEIWDPNPNAGIKKSTHALFLNSWTGYIIAAI
jgi:ATP-binding cassette subfamily B protein